MNYYLESILALFCSILKDDYFKNKEYMKTFYLLQHLQYQLNELIPLNILMKSYLLNIPSKDEEIVINDNILSIIHGN